MESKRYTDRKEFVGEIVVEGVYLSHSKEHREWEKDGVKKELDLDVLFLQGDYGVCVVRCYNPSYDISTFKVGDKLCFPVEKFEKENGLKSFVIRI